MNEVNDRTDNEWWFVDHEFVIYHGQFQNVLGEE